MKNFAAGATVLLVFAASVAGCTEPFEAATAYASQRALCEPENLAAWKRELAACQSGAKCAGVLSFSGQLQGQPVVVESRLSSFRVVLEEANGERVVERYEAIGDAPYFNFLFRVKDVGGVPGVVGMRTLQFGSPDPASSTGAPVRGALRLTAGGNSESLPAGVGTITFAVQGEREVVARMEGAFGDAEDVIKGCFHAFVSRTSVAKGRQP